MIKRLLFVSVIVSLFFSSVVFADTVSKDITAQNVWSDAIVPNPVSSITSRKSGFLNVSIGGTWVATVTLQRSFDSEVTWKDVKTWSSNTERALIDKTPNVDYRIGVKTGEFTSGTVVTILNTD